MTAESQGQDSGVEPPRYLVMAGASAEGADAMLVLLRNLPKLPATALIYCQGGGTDAGELQRQLSEACSHEVHRLEDDTVVESGGIYLAHASDAIAFENTISLAPVDKPDQMNPVDRLFRAGALAGMHPIGILLSGSGADGTLGLDAIKQAGGLTIVQTPESAEPDEMPVNAIRLGRVDCVASLEEIPEILSMYIKHHQLVCEGKLETEEEQEAKLHSLLEVLQHKTGLDLRHYRRSVLERRIRRRMGYTRQDTWTDYIECVRREKTEADTLIRDLLINVTQFFRDAPAWRLLQEKVLPEIIERIESKGVLRAWVPACASGEEAYSLAIILSEAIAASGKELQFQIFATDLRPESLERARRGIYPSSIATDVPGPYLERYFTRDGNIYQIQKSLRDRIIFASHDILGDPPFGNLDLVSCRNLLIYLLPDAQRRLLQLIRYSLKDQGVLFLGKAESAGQQVDNFVPVSKKWRIYRNKRDGAAHDLRFMGPRTVVTGTGTVLSSQGAPEEDIRKSLLQMYAPPCVVVDKQLHIKYTHGPVHSFLNESSGAPTTDLAQLCPPELRAKLWAGLRKCMDIQGAVMLESVPVTAEGEQRVASVHIQPIGRPTSTPPLFLVAFHMAAQSLAAAAAVEPMQESTFLQELEQELQNTRMQLHSMIEELERSNEALRASNEEIMSMNEELQSANEELETSREELQSLNEELRAVNLLLEAKVQAAEESRNDIENLLSSINIPTLFLDKHLCIKRFTPATTRLLSLIDSDIGRPVRDFAHKFIDASFPDDVAQALEAAEPSEKAIQTRDGRNYMRRIHPYVTREGMIDGLVVTFWDVTELRRIQDALRLNEERFRTALRESPVVVYQQDLDLRYTWVYNAQAALAESDYLGRTAEEVYDDPATVERLNEIKRRVLRTGTGERTETKLMIRGKLYHFYLALEPLRDQAGEVTGLIAAATDISDRVNGELDRRRLAAIVESSSDAILAKTLDGIITNWNRGAEILYGYSSEEVIGQSITILAPPGYEGEIAQLLRCIRAKQAVDPIETIRRRKDGSLVDISLTISPVLDSAGDVIGASIIARDISARKKAEAQLLELNENLERRIAERTRSMLQYQEQLKNLASQLTLAEQQERRRLSTELHDYLAQQLVVCQMQLARANKALGTDRAESLLHDVDEMIGKCLQYTRTLVAELSPSVLFEMGLAAAIQWLGNQMATHELQVMVEVECPEPDLSDDEAILLFKTVRELLLNVVKHAKTDRARVVLGRDEASDFVVTVMDDGAGFDPSEIGRHPTAAGKYGLFSLRERLDVLDGRFEIDAAPGHGSRIKLIVPYRSKETIATRTGHAPESNDASNSRTPAAGKRHKHLRLVIADDHRLVREGIRNLFSSFEDIEVLAEAENGQDAIVAARTHQPDVVVMDVNMPIMNGIEATRLLKQEMPHIAVVGLSVYDDKEIAASMLEAGAAHYVTKGSPADDLYAAVQAAAGRVVS